MKPKHIPQPDNQGIHKLNAMELNKERFKPKQTVLTPELVEELMKQRQDLTDSAAHAARSGDTGRTAAES